MTVVADFATVSVPEGQGVLLRAALADVCLQLPDAVTDPLGVRLGRFGLLRFSSMHGVAVASASGAMLAALRSSSLLSEYCAAVASVVTFNVTHLDLAYDAPADAPVYIAHLYAKLRECGVALSRKRIPTTRIKLLVSRSIDGRDTGSIMIGDRGKSRVSAIVYDRQHDAACKGKPDPGPLVRTELRLGIPGMSLRDVVEPAPLFYQYAAPGLFDRPADVPAWIPFGTGFAMDRKQYDAQEQLQRLVDRSIDLGRMLELADQLPGEGTDVLLRMIRQRGRVRHTTLNFAAGVAAARGSEQTPEPTPPDQPPF